MEFQRIQNAIELLGPVPPPAPPPPTPSTEVRPADQQRGSVEPKLEIAWGGFHQGFWSSVAALFGPAAAKNFRSASAFRDSWVEGRVPKRAVIAAALWHAAFLALPFSLLTGMPHRNPAFQNVEFTWSGPIEDLPLLEIARVKRRVPEKAKPDVPPTPRGAAAYHPRQRIFTDPVRPTHPRQTLINPKAPFEPPKLLPNLPNIVQFQKLAGPAKPRLQITEEMLKKLRPHEKTAAAKPRASPSPRRASNPARPEACLMGRQTQTPRRIQATAREKARWESASAAGIHLRARAHPVWAQAKSARRRTN